MKCKICKSETKYLFKNLVLNKYQVDYFKCPNCDFIQTENPHWLDEAYNNAITDLDVGLVSRNLIYSNIIEEVIKNNFNCSEKFLDYGGGYGLFVRLMRDKGFNFYREDKYCKNVFAKNFDIEDLSEKVKFEAVTAFEVFEHLENTLEELKEILKYSDTVIFSTELQPYQEIKNSNDWWYFTPETGQHISFYSEKTLKSIADKCGLVLHSKENLHILSKRSFEKNPLIINRCNDEINKIEIKSLIHSDFELVNNMIKEAAIIEKEFDGIKSKKLEDFNQRQKLLVKLSLICANLDSTKAQLDLTKTQLDSTNAQLRMVESELDAVRTELNQVYSSRLWRLATLIRNIMAKVAPNNSRRRESIYVIWDTSKRIRKSLVFGALRVKATFFKKHLYKKRKINTSSKKVVFIGHSYHAKTKSSEFFIDYLKSFFDIDVIFDESAYGKSFADIAHIDESYFAVIFWQNLPDRETIEKIKNKNENIVFVPMYDAIGKTDYSFVKYCQDFKIISFCKALHQSFTSLGLDSLYVQYFPEPCQFYPGEKEEIFFWQRTNDIDIKTVQKLLGSGNFKIHVHTAVDPYYHFVSPTKNTENEYQITYSNWYSTKEAMLDVEKQKGIYIAPRKTEGIGMSFLEAMAMGKAVVACDNPTMNEYIRDGKTGYLFDLKRPKPIDFSGISDVQRKAYAYMQAGYKRWQRDKKNIIDFIRKP